MSRMCTMFPDSTLRTTGKPRSGAASAASRAARAWRADTVRTPAAAKTARSVGPAPSRHSPTASAAPPPRASRAGAARRACQGPRLARPGRLRRLRASPSARRGSTSCVAGDGFAAHRARPCTGVRTCADTSAPASVSVLRTTASGSGRIARRSRAASAPLRRLRRRRLPQRWFCRFGCPDRLGRPWVSHPTHRRCSLRLVHKSTRTTKNPLYCETLRDFPSVLRILLNPVPRSTQETTVPRIVSFIVNKDIHQRGTTIPDLSFLWVSGLPSVEFVEPLSSVEPTQEIGVNVRQVARVPW